MPPTPLRTALGRLRAWWRSVGCTPAEQIALGVLVAAAVAVLVVLWWLQRPRLAEPAMRATPGASAPAAGVGADGSQDDAAAAGARTGSSVTAAPQPTATPTITVHVTGHVAAPGVYDLEAAARVVDALAAAGGPSDTAAIDQLNLAAPLTDGAQVRVPAPGEPAPPGGLLQGGVAGDGAAAGTPIDLNRADQAALETLPGVGPVTAERILAHRDEVGGFYSVDELLDVRGIGPATVDDLRDVVVIR